MTTSDTIEIFIAMYGTEGGAKDALKDFQAAQRRGHRPHRWRGDRPHRRG